MKFWRASSTFWGKVGNELLPSLAELASRLQRPQARHTTDNNFAKEFRLQNKLWKKLLEKKHANMLCFGLKYKECPSERTVCVYK